MTTGRSWLLLLVGAVLVAACGGQPSSVSWRNVTLPVPEGWHVSEEGDTHLSLANAEIGPDAIRDPEQLPEGPIVAMYLSYEPHTIPDDWREHVEQQDATLESDRQIRLGDGEVPATQLVFSYTTNDIPTREMVVVIPSRGIVVLAQPVPRPDDTDAPEVFLDHVDTFVEVLETGEYGPPVME